MPPVRRRGAARRHDLATLDLLVLVIGPGPRLVARRDWTAHLATLRDLYHEHHDELLDRYTIDELSPWSFWMFDARVPRALREAFESALSNGASLPGVDRADHERRSAARRRWLTGAGAPRGTRFSPYPSAAAAS